MEQPSWYDGKMIDEVAFCASFLHQHPMKCVRNRLFTVDGMIEDEGKIQQMILDEVMTCQSIGIAKKVKSLFDTVKLMAYSDPLPIETDRIHGYIEWLAFAEYQLAIEESKRENGSLDFVAEMTDNALRRYETVMEHTTDSDLQRRAALGKAIVPRFLERTEEADWTAEFEYPDPEIKTAEQLLSISKTGRELLRFLEEEQR